MGYAEHVDNSSVETRLVGGEAGNVGRSLGKRSDVTDKGKLLCSNRTTVQAVRTEQTGGGKNAARKTCWGV